jgi:hypothetical protein
MARVPGVAMITAVLHPLIKINAFHSRRINVGAHAKESSMSIFRVVTAVLAMGFAIPFGNAQSISQRGQTLYELRCGDCHSHSLHMRSRPKARSYEEVRTWVKHWSGLERMNWEKQDIDAVTRYLNERFYKYPCPGDSC